MSDRDLRPELEALLLRAEQLLRTEEPWSGLGISADDVYRGWAGLVGRLEGRRWIHEEEYIHDIGLRDLLDEIIDVLRFDPEQHMVVNAVDEVDERFRTVTVRDDQLTLWDPAIRSAFQWWMRRLPREGELAERIRRARRPRLPLRATNPG